MKKDGRSFLSQVGSEVARRQLSQLLGIQEMEEINCFLSSCILAFHFTQCASYLVTAEQPSTAQ